MAHVTLRQRVNARVAARLRLDRRTRRDHPRFVLRGHQGTRLVLPFGPLPTSHAGRGRVWSTLSRGAGRDPLLVDSEGQLATISFTLTLAHRDRQQPVTDWIRGLNRAADRGERLVVTYGATEDGVWVITELSTTVTDRRFGSNAPTRADAQLTLTRVGNERRRVGPGRDGGGSRPRGGRVHVVKRGDTLWKLARRYYDDGSKWRRIGDANHVHRPHRDLKPGRRLRIPRVG